MGHWLTQHMSEITLSSATMTGLLGLLLILLCILVYRVMTDKSNELECWQFFASRGEDGKHYADVDKLGKVVGIAVGSWVIIKLSYEQRMDAVILGTYFAYVGAVAGYSAFLRSKRDEPK